MTQLQVVQLPDDSSSRTSSVKTIQLSATSLGGLSSAKEADNGGYSFSAAIAYLSSWINEINSRIVKTWADEASKLALVNQRYTEYQTTALQNATNEPWPSGVDKDANPDDFPDCHPGINYINPDGKYARTWQDRAQQFYQQLQLQTQANITSSNTAAQNASDDASDGSKTTQGDYNIISQLLQIMTALRQNLPA